MVGDSQFATGGSRRHLGLLQHCWLAQLVRAQVRAVRCLFEVGPQPRDLSGPAPAEKQYSPAPCQLLLSSAQPPSAACPWSKAGHQDTSQHRSLHLPQTAERSCSLPRACWGARAKQPLLNTAQQRNPPCVHAQIPLLCRATLLHALRSF